MVGSRAESGPFGGKLIRALGLCLLAASSHCAGQADEEDTPCVELCELAQGSCAEAPTGECNDHCLAEDYRVERTSCRARYDELIECSLGLDDVCVAANECAGELNRYRQCVAAYCAGHSSEDACRGIVE